MEKAQYVQCDIGDRQQIEVRSPAPAHPSLHHTVANLTPYVCLQAAIRDADLVLHTAGPFQHSSNFNVIEAAIAAKTPYIDVCDDTHYSEK
jgi:saccharopine dehydrogenase-like NADP-dependent oxidoreductase